jgi:glycosyltransferase involved in cell wall biosynthesis
LISIIIPTYNDNDSLKLCLKSIADSDNKPLEVIVVDDGSLEPAGDIVAAYGYRYLRLARNSGQATARNEGARAALGSILFFIDSDVAIRKDTIARVAAAHDCDDVFIYQGIPAKTSLNGGFGPDLLSLKMYYMLKDCRQASYIHSHLFSIKKRVYEEVGGFDPRFRPPGCGEEFDLGHKVRKKYIIYTDPELVADQKGVSVLSRALVLYHRAYSWALLFSQTGRFESTNASFGEAMSGAFSAGAVICMLLGFFHPYFLAAATVFLLSHLCLGFGFYCFLMQERGIIFMLCSVIPNMLWSITATVGGIICLLTIPGKRREIH